jgi:predicted phage terminase large subunit-like protein
MKQLSRDVLNKIKHLPAAQQVEFLDLLDEYDQAIERDRYKQSFIAFVERMWPEFIAGRHHKIMAEAFEKIARGELKRLIINMPPRHTKSEFASYLLPAWFLGQYPQKKIIQSSHTAELAVGFGRKVRNLLAQEEYQEVFPDVGLRSDSKAAGRWNTSKGGDYFAIGIGGAVTGKGADLLIIDDPHSEQEGQSADPKVFEHTYEWYTSGPRQRLQPGGAIVIVMTRWSKKDLTGRIIDDAARRGTTDEWEVIEFPALLGENEDRPLWPEFWSLKELTALKNELPLPKWMAQYMQRPTSEEAAIIKREWWQEWEKSNPPVCDFIIQSWDTAFTKKTRSDPSACTTWGVFFKDESDGSTSTNIILLDAFDERMEFPELKRRAVDEYQAWQPDICIIEAKASGLPLIFEMRQAGIPVQDFTPSRGNDKLSRVNAVSDLFASGRVWAPQTRWAEKVIEQFADFPNGDHDDLVDSSTQALLRFRQGGFVKLSSDEGDTEFRPRRAAYY